MRLDPMLDLMIDRPQLEIVFQVFERSLDFGQLNVELPEIGGIAISEIGAQQIAPFTSAHLAQLLAVEREAERSPAGGDIDVDQPPHAARALERAAPSFIRNSLWVSFMFAICFNRDQ